MNLENLKSKILTIFGDYYNHSKAWSKRDNMVSEMMDAMEEYQEANEIIWVEKPSTKYCKTCGFRLNRVNSCLCS